MAHQVICRFDAPRDATEIHLPIGYKAVGITQHPNGVIVWGEKMLYSDEREKEPEDARATHTTEQVVEQHPYHQPPVDEEEADTDRPSGPVRRPGGDEEAP